MSTHNSKFNDGGRGRGRGRGGGRGRGRGGATNNNKMRRTAEEDLEGKLGFELFTEGEPRLGWLLTMTSSSFEDQDDNKTFSCVDLYFVSQDGSTFKTKYKFAPYFYVATKEKMQLDVEAYLRRRYEDHISDIEIVEKEDLDLKNHLSGMRRTYLKVSFDTVQDLTHVKSDLLPVVERNQAKLEASEAFESFFSGRSDNKQRIQDYLDCIIGMREYDVPYHVRFAIDNDARCGQWYTVKVDSSKVTLEKRADLLQRAEVRVCAFDIETTKLPLKFPDAEYDMIMMISYMVDGQGYLIINRECVGGDIEDLEYTPKPEFEGNFKVANMPNEKELLRRWFNHMQELKPGVYVTYNGDFFDWPFVEQRAMHHGMKMSDEIGFRCDQVQGECRAKFACHLDCFAWVKRDSYLPQGSQGLKAVTKAKLGYDPLEVNPEDMVRFAIEKPQIMASYSVSDAVATYYLYMTYVHPFIFSLATIIPMPPDEVLRKGSGTLCEMLLMVQAFKGNIICPNKHQAEPERFSKGHLLESETYIGGHVECLESGVFRSDLPTKFRLDPLAYQQLIDNLDRDLQYAIKVEGKMDLDSVINYEEVKNDIKRQLESLRDVPNRDECPLIYHLDVAAMYPNIILTNRLQPPSIVTDDVCAACDFNRPGKTCLRQLEWVWRGESYMATRSEYYHLKNQIESEQIPTPEGQLPRFFRDLPKEEQQTKLKDRLKKYCQKVYKRVLEKPVTERRVAGICMRENPFYSDTVRSFRDRRYEYKGLNKIWKGKLAEAKSSGNPIKVQEAQDMVVVYDSLQLAHKCILNSFYGYVMRKGARWYSMEMAGVVTYTGAKIIQNARLLVEKIGKPLELDTDGIWCALPGSFPENFSFKTIFDTVNHSFGSSDSSLFSKTENLRQLKVQVAAYYSDSTSGAFEYQGELGYHPLEEVNECEKSGRGDLRLTDAEIARTTVEANHRAIVLFSGMVHSDPHKDISRIELQYIVDDYGDIYIELENNGNILRSPRASNPVNVFIGLDVDDIHRYGEQDIAAAEDHNKINNEDIGGIDNKDDEEERNSISIGDDSSISESSRDWEKLDTANKVHPINFAEKIAKVVSTDYFVKMDRPSNGISIIGLLRPAYVEEESYLRKFLYSPSYSSGDDNYTEEDEDSNGSGEPSSPYDDVRDSRPAEIASTVELENMSNSRDLDVTDSSPSDELFTESSVPQDNDPDLVSMMLPDDGIPWELGSEESDMNSSIYKLDILSVQLVSVYGNQSIVSLEDFQHAEPDILVYSATEIIDRVDNGGGKTKRALRSLLWKRKGLHVEEAFLIGVDSLGVDIRVHCGAEVHTVRIAFDCRANSGDAAERQLRRLLFPRFRHKQRKSRRGRYKAS